MKSLILTEFSLTADSGEAGGKSFSLAEPAASGLIRDLGLRERIASTFDTRERFFDFGEPILSPTSIVDSIRGGRLTLILSPPVLISDWVIDCVMADAILFLWKSPLGPLMMEVDLTDFYDS